MAALNNYVYGSGGGNGYNDMYYYNTVTSASTMTWGPATISNVTYREAEPARPRTSLDWLDEQLSGVISRGRKALAAA